MEKKELTQQEFIKRMKEADMMAEIWEENGDVVKAYLKGCISTAAALAGREG